MKYVVAVHLGTFFTSGPSQVDGRTIAECLDGIEADIAGADGLVVIDGSFSDAIPGALNRLIAARLEECARQCETAARVWGCDAGDPPYPGWEAGARQHGFGLRFPDQETAAAAALPFLLAASEILVTGAWATRDHSSGCASSVYKTLRELLPPRIDVRLSDACLFEESIDQEDDLDQGPVTG